jgi:hypothetical protein
MDTRRRFDGKTYSLHSSVHLKPHAQNTATYLRGKGKLARVVKGSKGGWLVYVR